MEEEDDPLDWEEWDPSKGTFIHHMIAGSRAGVVEHTCMFPVDTVKVIRSVHWPALWRVCSLALFRQTHTQCQRCHSIVTDSSWGAARQLVQAEGPMRLWRGVTTMFGACIPAHAAYFSIYESCKERFGANKAGHHPLAAGMAG